MKLSCPQAQFFYSFFINCFNQYNFMFRQSSFLLHDIEGSVPRTLIPKQPKQSSNFLLSTFVQPIPNRSHNIKKTSDPLFIDDIEGSRPKCSQFRSKRVVDPLCPQYLLPSSSQIIVDPGRKFIRDTLQISDINASRNQAWMNRAKQILKQPIQGSQPSQLTRQLKSVPRLQVRDINKDGVFQSSRHSNPLKPNYQWRDQQDGTLNQSYGDIKGSQVKRIHPIVVNRDNNFNLNIKDIQGTQANSSFAKAHFVDKRREFRNYLLTQDIEKANASSLKKGIVTFRQTNPLMPNYQYPGSKQQNK